MPQLREGEMQDPSLDTKKELTETGEDVVEEFGKMMKLLLKGASISEDLNAVIKSFAVHEQNIAKTDGIVRQLSLVTQEMDISRARLLKSCVLLGLSIALFDRSLDFVGLSRV
eukprot:TRINITY_DN1448_c0_g1_i6.p2 TRINITY_DN1448_c0_g1~~TRINITY_DN1448_c0_g1_i6.p2  ORF type:complete len:113 (-),score=33.98 TRINITY_DN1448_c0_g1_i6:244-582(-)